MKCVTNFQKSIFNLTEHLFLDGGSSWYGLGVCCMVMVQYMLSAIDVFLYLVWLSTKRFIRSSILKNWFV